MLLSMTLFHGPNERESLIRAKIIGSGLREGNKRTKLAWGVVKALHLRMEERGGEGMEGERKV